MSTAPFIIVRRADGIQVTPIRAGIEFPKMSDRTAKLLNDSVADGSIPPLLSKSYIGS